MFKKKQHKEVRVNFFNTDEAINKENKYVEVNNKVKQYYGIMKNDNNKNYILDFEGTSRYDAEAHFAIEGLERGGHKVEFVGVY